MALRQLNYSSPASCKTALRVLVDTLKRSSESLSNIGATAGIKFFFFALSNRPNVPVKGMPSSSAARRPKASSRITEEPGASRAKANTADSPGPRSAARGRAGALMGSLRRIHGSVMTSGSSMP